MAEYSNVSYTIRVPAELLESARIMAAIFNVGVSQYIETALMVQLDGDIAANMQAYETLRKARKQNTQEKGA